MKKLTYLFLALIIVACSSDDSSDGGNQLFLEKYDSVVWERLPLDNQSYRIAFIDSSNSITQYSSSFGEDMEEMCSNTPLEGTTDGLNTTTIQEETENSLSILVQYENDEVVGSFITVFTVTSDGSTYTLTQTQDGEDYEEEIRIYTRTEYDVCF